MDIENTKKMMGEYGLVCGVGPMLMHKIGCWTAKRKIIEGWLERRYGEIPARYAQCQTNLTDASRPAEKVLWTLWLGDHVPEMAVQTMRMMKQMADGYRVRTLVEADIPLLLDIPDLLWDKYRAGIIHPVHFSDIIRFMLLRRYGGIWLDATVLMTKPLPQTFFEKDFMTCRTNIPDERFAANGRWCGFLLGAGQTNTVVFSYMEDMYRAYWAAHDTIVDYLLMDDLMDIGCARIPAMAKALADVPVNNPQFHALTTHLNDTYCEEIMQQLCSDTFLHHLNWKKTRSVSAEEDTFYNHLLRNH